MLRYAVDLMEMGNETETEKEKKKKKNSVDKPANVERKWRNRRIENRVSTIEPHSKFFSTSLTDTDRPFCACWVWFLS